MDLQVKPADGKFVKLCRICLQNKDVFGNEMAKIYDIKIDELNISLCDLFAAFTALPMEQTEGFPTLICTNCQNSLVSAYEFQIKCIKSDHDVRMALGLSLPKSSIEDKLEIIKDPIKTESNVIFFKEHNDYIFGSKKPIKSEPVELNSPEVLADYDDKTITTAAIIKPFDFHDGGGAQSSTSSSDDDLPDADWSFNSPETKKTSKKKKKSYNCKICNRPFSRVDHLFRHLKTHDSEGKPFECDVCKRRFVLELNMVRHKKTHSSDKAKKAESDGESSSNESSDYSTDDDTKIMKLKKKHYKCLVCEKTFDKPSAWLRHSVVHKAEGKPYECNICKKRFDLESRLEYHKLSHSADLKTEVIDEQSTASKIDDQPRSDGTTAEPSEEQQTTNIKSNKNTFICFVCDKDFEKMSALLRHSKIHDSKGRPFECKFCKRRFTSERRLICHEITHSSDVIVTGEEKPTLYPCCECPREFLKQESLSAHMRVHRDQNVQSFSCDYCKKTFSKFYHLKRHMQAHVKTKVFRCRNCDKTFTAHEELVEHRKEHKESETDLFCGICNKTFLKLTALKYHLRLHNEGKRCLCSECGKTFTNNSKLKSHFKIHTNIRPYKCTLCPYAFQTSSNLKSHMVTHTGVKAHTCDTCGSTFTRPDSLRKHIMRIHAAQKTKEKSLACSLCDMKFYMTYEVVRHMRTHTGEKPFKCDYCDRAFAQKGDLNKHTRSHIGENTYQCKECPAAFKMQIDLKRHNQEHFLQKKYSENNEEATTAATAQHTNP